MCEFLYSLWQPFRCHVLRVHRPVWRIVDNGYRKVCYDCREVLL